MKKFLPLLTLAGVMLVIGYVAAAQPQKETITQFIASEEDTDGLFDVLNAALDKAGLAEELGGKNTYTLLAPIDGAFRRAFEVSDEAAALQVVAEMDTDELTTLMLNHVIRGNRSSQSLWNAQQYQTLGGDVVTKEQLQAAGIASRDRDVKNGVIHVIDGVLFPAVEEETVE